MPEALSALAADAERGSRRRVRRRPAGRPALKPQLSTTRRCGFSLVRPTDPRQATVKVAGPAALLVAEFHKLGERASQPHRLVDKDAHDIYRLLVATETADLARRSNALIADEIARAPTATQWTIWASC